MKKIKLFFMLISISQVSPAYEIICPQIPYTAISAEIIPKVSFNKKTSLYKYQYTFKNNSNSQLPLDIVRMETYSNVQSAKALNYWDLTYRESANEILWGAMPDPELNSMILPGKSLSGFEFESPNPPGPIKYKVGGWKSINKKGNFPQIKFAPGEAEKYADDEIETNCPGEDFADRMPEIIGITIGPIPPDTIIAKLRLKRISDKKWHGQFDESDDSRVGISPLDTGKIQVMLFDDKDIDVSKIDLKSIQFGPGKAAPLSTKFTQYIDDEKDTEIVEHLKKYNKSHLLMEFDLAALKVECDIDRVLFLSAKIGDKKLSGAVKIRHALCADVHKIKKEKEKSHKVKKDYIKSNF